MESKSLPINVIVNNWNAGMRHIPCTLSFMNTINCVPFSYLQGGLSNKFRPEKVNRSSNKDGSTSGQWLTLTAFGVAGALVTAFLAR